ncbi:MAG: hypothetical protein RIB60_09225 [Phycisphaerales bacterium]
MLTTLMLAATIGMAPETATIVRPLADVVEIRPQMMDLTGQRADQVRDVTAESEVVGHIDAEGNAHWIATDRNERTRRGGENAPSLIYVRVFDGVFAIDPFEPLPQTDELNELYAPVDINTARQLFNGSSLQTDRALFDRRRIERTEELFRALERARRGWLKANGYAGVRTFTNPSAGGDEAAVQGTPEPAGWFRKPAELPRGKSREAVQAEPMSEGEAASVASNILEGATRVSTPPSMPVDQAERLAESVEPASDDEVAING